MNRILVSLVLSSLLFSSCFLHRTPTDEGADEALGLSTESEKATAQQELERLQKAQLEEQKRQLDRQITDPVVNQNIQN